MTKIVSFLCAGILLLSCTPNGPQEIKYGKDDCYSCKMTIVDNRFAVEIVNKKRKAYKFDDLYCALGFLKSDGIKQEEIFDIYVNDYSKKGELIPTKTAYFITSMELRSPMGGNIAAFALQSDQQDALKMKDASVLTWSEILEENAK